MLKTLFAIGMGSFAGGVLRYLLSKATQTPAGTSFPVGTLTVNLLGCLFIGILYGLFDRGALLHPTWRLFLTVGFCGGFTTFSTFMNENLLLLKGEEFIYFAIYTASSLLLGLFMVYLGQSFVKLI